jgi:hypothetical protein
MMMDRRAFVAGTLALLAAPLAGGAQSSAMGPRIGLLIDAPWEPLRQGLRDLGYLEGRNIVFELRDSGDKTSDGRISRQTWSG